MLSIMEEDSGVPKETCDEVLLGLGALDAISHCLRSNHLGVLQVWSFPWFFILGKEEDKLMKRCSASVPCPLSILETHCFVCRLVDTGSWCDFMGYFIQWICFWQTVVHTVKLSSSALFCYHGQTQDENKFYQLSCHKSKSWCNPQQSLIVS